MSEERTYKQGFRLSTKDLEKLISDIRRSFSACGQDTSVKFEIDLRDSTSLVLKSLEEVFELENSGHKAIELIRIKLGQTEDLNRVEVEFTSQSGFSLSESIRVLVDLENRDQERLLIMDISERIKNIKTTSWNQILSKFILFSLVLGMLSSVAGIYLQSTQESSWEEQAVAQLEELTSAEPVQNVSELALLILKIRIDEKNSLNKYFKYVILPCVMIAALGMLLLVLTTLIDKSRVIDFQSYVFEWGDMESNTSGQKVATVLIGTIVLGTIGSLIANLIWEFI